MNALANHRLATWAVRLEALAAALALLYAILFIVAAVLRSRYTYELDWLEGNMLATSLRVLEGREVYAPPSLDFTAFLYPPFYYYVAAASLEVFGTDYLALRVVSIAATLATAALVAAEVHHRGGTRVFALLGAGVFLAYFAHAGHFFDIGRVDALATCLLLASVVLAGRRGVARVLAGGAIAALAVLTKQSAAAPILAAVVWLFIARGPRDALLFVAAGAATTLAFLSATGLLTNVWFYHYVIRIPASHPIDVREVFVGGVLFLALTLPWPLWGFVAATLGTGRIRALLRASPWPLVFAAAIVMAVVMRGKYGGYKNVFLPAAAVGAVLGCIAALEARAHGARRLAIAALVTAQLFAMAHWPPSIVPGDAETRAGDRLVADLRALPGDVYVPAFPAYAARAGKPWRAHTTALCDAAQAEPSSYALAARGTQPPDFVVTNPDLERVDVGRCDAPPWPTRFEPSERAITIDRTTFFGKVHAHRLGAILRRAAAPAHSSGAGTR